MLDSTSGLPFVVATTTAPKILGIFKISGPPSTCLAVKVLTRPVDNEILITYPKPLVSLLTIMTRYSYRIHAMCEGIAMHTFEWKLFLCIYIKISFTMDCLGTRFGYFTKLII